MDILENLIRSTVKINTTDKYGNQFTGTGFVYHFDITDSTCIPGIITNKHVVDNMSFGNIQFSIMDDNNQIIPNKFYHANIGNFEKNFIYHPNENIDLCILPIGELYENMEKNDVHYFSGCVRDIDVITEKELNSLGVVEEVYMIGYPDGLKDNINNIPITRKGITATPLKYNYMDQPITLLDIPVYGGSSGSPVFTAKQIVFKDKGKTFVGYRLLGIVNSVYQHGIEGTISSNHIEKVKSLIPNNVGLMIKASQLKELEEEYRNRIIR